MTSPDEKTCKEKLFHVIKNICIKCGGYTLSFIIPN